MTDIAKPSSTLFSPTARIRRFNRAVTTEVGALESSYLGRGRPLGPARVLTSLAPEGTEVAGLRARLNLDSGLMSRMLRGLEEEGLVETCPDPEDGRRRIAKPTAAGTDEIAAYEDLSETRAQAMLAALPQEQEALLAAMDRIAVVLNRDRISLAPTDPAGPAARSCLGSYYAELSRRFGTVFDPGTDAEVAAEAEGFRPPHGLFLTAVCEGLPVGCVALRLESETAAGARIGEVKRLWVGAEARGLGLSRRLMQAVEDQARGMGFTALRLDTNATLVEAIALYRRSGWTEIAAYNDNPYAQHWFEKPL